MARNSEIKSLSNIWRMGQVSDTKFGVNVFDKRLMLQNPRFIAFTVSEPLPENGRESNDTPTHNKVNIFFSWV